MNLHLCILCLTHVKWLGKKLNFMPSSTME